MRGVLFRCPYCEQVFEGSREDAGIECECPMCGRDFLLEVVADAPKRLPNGFQWYLGIFRKYCRLRGRARRREFWWSFLVQFCALLVLTVVGEVFDLRIIPILFIFITAIPMYAVQIRRLHDTNKSGWWYFLQFVPVVQIAYYVWMATDGDSGRNRFGPDPKGR